MIARLLVPLAAAALAGPSANAIYPLQSFKTLLPKVKRQTKVAILLPGKANLRLSKGDPALFHPITCGASCSPATLWFVHKGVLYAWQLKDAPKNAKTVLRQAADAAVAAGPR